MYCKRVIAVFAAAAWCLVASAQPKFDYSDIAKGMFAQKSVAGLRSMADGEHYTVRADSCIVRYDYSSGQVTDTVCIISQLGIDGRVADYSFSGNERKILFTVDSKPLYRRSAYSACYVYDIASHRIDRLTESDSVRLAVFSPDGGKVAYVLDNNIFIKSLNDNHTVQVTRDGEFNRIINGLPDWVYEEEFAVEGEMCWSPDGERLAFLRSNESEVREFSFSKYLTDEGKDGYSTTYSYKYPVAGERNSTVSLHVYDLNSRQIRQIDTGEEERDRYVPFFDWTPDGRLYFFRINRLQNHLEVILCDGEEYRTIYEERSDKYIDDITPQTISFLSDSRRFIVRNETSSGYFHLYLYHIERGLVAPITSGDWEVTEIVSFDDKRVWYLSTESSPACRELYCIGINGRGKRKLSSEEGTYRISPSGGCKYYISYFSNVSTPNLVTLHSGDGRLIRTLEENDELKKTIAEIGLPQKEFVSFTTPEGYELFGYVIKPSDFDPSKRYPVLFSQYSGPGSQQVSNRWSMDWEDALVQHGYIVACFDPRGTGFRGERFKKLTYGIMGRLETEDQISAARYMASLPYVDSSRIGIYGWSYGGFMALNCIFKGADMFRMAIAVAPVTSWRYYDSVYTERVNGLPQQNPEGYDEPSPIGYADSLKGKLLLMHGTGDDNVHVVNTYRMVDELLDKGKKFDLMLFPDDNHSMVPKGRNYVREKMVEYCLENL